MSTTFKGPVVSDNGFTGALTGAVTATTAAATTSLTVGGGTAVTKIVKGTIAVDLASVATRTVTEVTLTLTGAAVNDVVIMNPLAAGNTASLIFGGARVSATNEVKMRIFNNSDNTVDEASQLWDYCLIRS